MLLKVFYTSIYGFLPHAQSHSNRHYQASLKTALSKTISLSNKLRQSNLDAVN